MVKSPLDIEDEQHNFLDEKGKIKNGRDNTKRAEKPYFHCGPQAEKVTKSTQYYLWKNVVVIKIMIVVIKAKQ